jgi:septum formation protein
MVLNLIEYLNKKKVVFGTTSQPRRKIMSDLGIKFEPLGSKFEENLPKTNPIDYVNNTCNGKFEEILQNIQNKDKDIEILITSDTIVVHKDKILEKAKNNEDIYEWFRSYSESNVKCYTSVIIGFISKNSEGFIVNKKRQFLTETAINFSKIDEESIKSYIDSGEPFNKAGGFGIQGIGSILIKEIQGCYYNVVGFPVNNFFINLKEMLDE